jgi:hypothetical protein
MAQCASLIAPYALADSERGSSPSLPSLQLATDVVAVEPRGLKHGLVATEALVRPDFAAFPIERLGLALRIGRPRARHARANQWQQITKRLSSGNLHNCPNHCVAGAPAAVTGVWLGLRPFC